MTGNGAPLQRSRSASDARARHPFANRLSWANVPLKRFWSPGGEPLLSYCQNVQDFQPPAGSAPASDAS